MVKCRKVLFVIDGTIVITCNRSRGHPGECEEETRGWSPVPGGDQARGLLTELREESR